MTWRDVRFATLRTASGLSPGRNSNEPIWCCHDGEQFRNERDAHDIVRSLPQGWYTDDERETAIGIVAGLPHGRFLAGYRWTSNDERVYFGEIFDDERVYFGEIFDDEDNAARAADGHAEAFAEVEREYSERWSAAQRLQDDIEEETERLRALRLDHSAHVVARKFNDAHERAAHDCREQVADVIATIREKRAELIPYSGML
jgi:nicotinamide mononucleotide adenylyltransferase